MTNDQEDYLNMSQTVITFLQDNSSIWENNIALSGVVQAVDTENDDIVDKQAEQEKSHTGVTTNKKNDRTNLETDGHLVANILSFYAAGAKDADLQEQVKSGTLDLARHSGLKLIGIAKVILQLGIDNLAKAKGSELTQAMLDDLSKHLDAFTKNLNAPRLAITAKSNATDMIETGIGNLHTLIEDQLDKGMVVYKGSPFYNQYKLARVTVHSATRHLALTVGFTDAGGQPLADVKVWADNGTDKVRRKSSKMGNIRIKNLLEGEHKLIAEKPGFATYEVSFIVAPPEKVKLTVVMKAI